LFVALIAPHVAFPDWIKRDDPAAFLAPSMLHRFDTLSKQKAGRAGNKIRDRKPGEPGEDDQDA
jgi:hypothetical protein